MKTTTELFTVSKEKIAKARKNVWTTVEELVRVLKGHERTMLTELDVIEKAQHRDYSTQLEHLQASVNELESSVKNCKSYQKTSASKLYKHNMMKLKGVKVSLKHYKRRFISHATFAIRQMRSTTRS